MCFFGCFSILQVLIIIHFRVIGCVLYRVRHKSVNTPLRHKSVNNPLSHELRARCVQQAVRGIKGVNRLMPHPVEWLLILSLFILRNRC